ncbi:hypothetical protein WJX72_005778 [[Myrmecia] bisecta]|uniref:HVA22-like protein n=1 Tax=[Myrmecia] bisecta TaxID=41462 RepID=A0AAW1PQ59_9CHLO
MLGDYLCRVLLNVFGYIWPAYQCYKAIERKQADKIREWCIYWFVMALFTFAERAFLDSLIFWAPMYYEAKVLFVIYLWHPKTLGAQYLYSHIVQPFIAANEGTIDQKVAEGKAWVGDFAAAHFSKVTNFVQSKAHLAVAQLQQLQKAGNQAARNHAAANVPKQM